MRRFERLLEGGLYRSRRGFLAGVCRGLAEYFDFSVFWTRAIALALLFFTGFWPMLVLYLIATLLMKPEPVVTIRSGDEQEFYDSYLHSRRSAADRIKRRYDGLERRIRRMEDRVTTPEFEWQRRMNG